jgi:hypothetical protein
MKWLVLFISLLFWHFLGAYQQTFPSTDMEKEAVPKTPPNRPFGVGEKLTYVLHYGIFNAGIAELEVHKESHPVHPEKETYHMVGKGWSTGAVDVFFKVRDRYESYMLEETLHPLEFVRRIDEGGFKMAQDYSFDPDSNVVVTQDNKTFEVPENIQDMISAFYYARTLNFDTAQIGSVYSIPAFVDNEIFNMKLKLVGRETISTRKGKYKCLKFNPLVQEGRIFKAEEDLTVWVSDDKNRIPILAKSKILVGSIKMELKEYSGLLYDLEEE